MVTELFMSGQNYKFYKEAALPDIRQFTDYCNSNADEEEKAAYFLYCLIVLEKLRKIPTAKEFANGFFNSEMTNKTKNEVAGFILKDMYISSAMREDFGIGDKYWENLKSDSEFINEAILSLDRKFRKAGTVAAGFDFIKREALHWLIGNSKNRKEYIKSLLKNKVSWQDIVEQNAVLDYCYAKSDELGKDFVLDIFEKSLKSNMGEVRLKAFRCAYNLTLNKKYAEMMASTINKKRKA